MVCDSLTKLGIHAFPTLKSEKCSDVKFQESNPVSVVDIGKQIARDDREICVVFTIRRSDVQTRNWCAGERDEIDDNVTTRLALAEYSLESHDVVRFELYIATPPTDGIGQVADNAVRKQ